MRMAKTQETHKKTVAAEILERRLRWKGKSMDRVIDGDRLGNQVNLHEKHVCAKVPQSIIEEIKEGFFESTSV